MPLAANTRLGTYEILSPLGAGGMGEVYRARDTRLGRDIALKVLPEEFARDADRLARFEREARTVAGLNHPNIVVLHSVEDEDGVRFLTMELVEGRSLDQLVTPAGLPIARVLELGLALADALVAAHEKGVVHRDLKPANVMVTREGRVKVLDFGLAKLGAPEPDLNVSRAATMAPLSKVDEVVGTVPYMAPEQVSGQAVDARTDLFALGIVLYELLAGRRPFVGTTMAHVMSSILTDSPAPIQSLRADVPRDLAKVIWRCLEKAPWDRFQTARDVYNELRYVWRELERGADGPTAGPMAAPAPNARPTAAPVPAPAPPSSAPVSSLSPSSTAPLASTPAKEIPSIAVLPFVNRSASVDDEYFSDGLAEELINVLTKLRGLRVAAQSSAFQFKGKNEDLTAIGQKLKVATILDGSVRKSGNRVRITVRLVKVSDGYQLWSESYDRTLEDIFAVQDNIAQSVVKELRTTLLGEDPDSKTSGEVRAEMVQAARGRASDAEAHRLYLQARHFIDRFTREDMVKAIGYLKEALERDPGFALGWAELGVAHVWQARLGWAPVAQAFGRAREAVDRALSLEPDLAEAHSGMGVLQKDYYWDRRSAAASFARALELAPGNAQVLVEAGRTAIDLGDQEAIGLLVRALEQDPLSSTAYRALGRAHWAFGRPAEAEAAYRKALELTPQISATHSQIALALLDQGRGKEALAEAMREPEEDWRLQALAIIHYAAGRTAESDAALRELSERHAEGSAIQIAEAHAVRGETEAAFEWLDRAYAQRDPGTPQMRTLPALRSLHGDPRWSAFLEKMGLAD